MFEDKSMRNKRKHVLYLLLLLFFGIAFGVGFFLNLDGGANIAKNPNEQSESGSLKIPDSLKNPDNTGISVEQEPITETTKISVPGAPTAGTKLVFKSVFTLCGHVITNEMAIAEDESKMTREELQRKYSDWDIVQYSNEQITLSRQIERYCPRHFIIATKDGFIAIYVYDENGNKLLRNKTDISVGALPPEDQKKLQSGIVADSEDELESTLEGFSD